MKLIIENFRKFVINENSKIDTLIIYDFDETLGKVQNDFVEFIDKSGNVVKSIEPGDYDGYQKFYSINKKLIGKEIFFKSPQLKQVIEKYGKQITPYDSVVNQMKNDIKKPNCHVIVLTARPKEDVKILKQVIHQDFKVPEINNNIFGVGGMGNVKGNFLVKLLNNFPNVENIIVYDDKQKNLDGIKNSLSSEKKYNFDLNLVKHKK